MGKIKNFLIITHVPHVFFAGKIWAYGPYVREMNLWIKQVEGFTIVAPVIPGSPQSIDLAYDFGPTIFKSIYHLNFSSPWEAIKSGVQFFPLFGTLVSEMSKSDHIHLRCPGNVGLVGCMAQIFFPKKKKTAKYAGNWDWRSKEPFSYRLQQLILRSTLLTHSMTALVYGQWPDKTKNIKPFFTATYSDKDAASVSKQGFDQTLELIYLGVLEPYKSPELVLETAKILDEKGIDFSLVFCGDGSMKSSLEKKSTKLNLNQKVRFLGNVLPNEVKALLMQSHFLVFISKSEGWPKAVAESMYWGCVPITTDVSCVGDMVGRSRERGVLVVPDPNVIAKEIQTLVDNPLEWEKMRIEGMAWARPYTLERFEEEIKKLI